MALHPDFPSSPFDVLDPEVRWFPADETLRDRGNAEIRARSNCGRRAPSW